MEWVLRSPQMHSTFSNLGFMHVDGYHINENCNVALKSILHNILTEDKYLRTYRRSISFGQNIQKDLVPLLLHAKEDSTIQLLLKILFNLTIPIECLLSVEVISQTDFGRHTVFEINNLLASTKAAFTDHRATKVVIDFLKKNADSEQQLKVSPDQCANISNSLLLLRNILHIPEAANSSSQQSGNGSSHVVQNQILWNIFSQSIDKILIKLMTMPEAANWGVTMVQLVALLYKDQHFVTLHKLLNVWLETCFSESSEDNESNTTPPEGGSEDSSPLMTSEPTSDSSDIGASGKSNDEPNCENNEWGAPENNTDENRNELFQPTVPEEGDVLMRDMTEHKAFDKDQHLKSDNTEKVISGAAQPETFTKQLIKKTDKKTAKSESSDSGYIPQIEKQDSISTSSNDDEIPAKKPKHLKPHNTKQRINNKVRSGLTLQERKRKKIVKRGKATIINVQGLTYKTPTDDDIANVLKEFTVDFLLKGYNCLVQTLHGQILTNIQLEIDTSHFFWLVTYFLKFATQIELDLEKIGSVLSFEIVSYLTAEGVNLCEQFELAIRLDGNYLKPTIRRLHLVVTAIREFIQAIEVYNKCTHICPEDQKRLASLQSKMCESDELRSLLVLLLRHYNPKYHSKQYLQDIIVTNHILLLFVDNCIKSPEYTGSTNMVEHIQQFATPEIMYQYGLLLEDYSVNGEFVNDCIFTLMHHVGGEIGSLNCLFQPKILKTFTSIWKSDFEICDDWSDLIEYVINTFIKKPHTLQSTGNFTLATENFDDQKSVQKALSIIASEKKESQLAEADPEKKTSGQSIASNSSKERWTEDELSSLNLNWIYLQCNTLPDVVGEIVKTLKEYGTVKTRNSVIKQLLKQGIIRKEEFDNLSEGECDRNSKIMQIDKEIRDVEIGKLCEQLRQDGKTSCLDWVQKVLLETCYAKLNLEKTTVKEYLIREESDITQYRLFNQELHELPVMSPVSYHSLLLAQSVPLVPWNCEQAAMCKDLRFLQLLHKLGFQMPVDTGKVFIRIPHFWTADFLYEVAGRVTIIDKTKLKFSLSDICDSASNSTQQFNFKPPANVSESIPMTSTMDNFYQIHKQKHFATMVNFTPMPGSAFDSDCIRDDDANKSCWLDVVKQSQDLKLSCSIGSKPEVVVLPKCQIGVVAQSPACGAEPAAPAPLAPHATHAPHAPHATHAPHAPHATHAPHAPHAPHEPQDSPNDSESDDNNSVCETASVASDLTRMYVSDEDEKSESPVLQNVKQVSPPLGVVAAGPPTQGTQQTKILDYEPDELFPTPFVDS